MYPEARTMLHSPGRGGATRKRLFVICGERHPRGIRTYANGYITKPGRLMDKIVSATAVNDWDPGVRRTGVHAGGTPMHRGPFYTHPSRPEAR